MWKEEDVERNTDETDQRVEVEELDPVDGREMREGLGREPMNYGDWGGWHR